MKTAFSMLAASVALATHVPGRAEPPGSLIDARLGVIKGTSPGIVLIGPGRSAQAPAAASSASAAGAATQAMTDKADAPPTAIAPKPAAERPGALLSRLEPPSGRPLNEAKRLDSPTQGITLPTARSAASQPTGKGRPTPGG